MRLKIKLYHLKTIIELLESVLDFQRNDFFFSQFPHPVTKKPR